MPNTCCDDTDNINKLFTTNNSKSTLILEYYPYKNWGRWNHNPSRIDLLIHKLNELGYNVQLKHNDDENDITHGNIYIKDSDNHVITSCEQFQHNSNIHNREILLNQIVNLF